MISYTAHDLVKLLERGVSRLSGERLALQRAYPFEITAKKFQEFAIDDSKGDSVRCWVNALGNVKRAVECRVDEVLYGLCLHIKSKNERWSFPKKIEILKDLSILAPGILKEINRRRNLLEHEYVIPNQNDVKDALDIASLFLGYTDKLHKSLLIRLTGKGYSITIDRVKGVVRIQGKETKGRGELKIGREDCWIDIAKTIVSKMKQHGFLPEL